MNTTSPKTSPRLICRVVRHRHPEPPRSSSWATRHVDSCPGCLAHYTAAWELEQELRKTAPKADGDLPSGLEDRIWAAVQADQSQSRAPQTRSTRWGRPAIVLVAAGLVAVIALVAWPAFSSNSTGATMAQSDFNEQDMRMLIEQIEDYSSEWLVKSAPPPGSNPTGPLSEELNALESDASAAVRFLKLSFFPSSASAS